MEQYIFLKKRVDKSAAKALCVRSKCFKLHSYSLCTCLLNVCCQSVIEQNHFLFLTGSCAEEFTVFCSSLVEIEPWTPSTETDGSHSDTAINSVIIT